MFRAEPGKGPPMCGLCDTFQRLIPLGLRALKIDPALASSVFITALTDLFGFLAFLGLATVFMRFLSPAL